MITLFVMTPEQEATREHLAWLEDDARWRSEHRQALAMLAKVQAAILQNEAALDTLSAEIRSYDVHLRECDGIGVGSPGFDHMLAKHPELAHKHRRAREIHEQVKNRHVNVVGQIEELLKMCESVSFRQARISVFEASEIRQPSR